MGTHRSRGSDDENDFSTDGKSPMPRPGDRPSSVPPGAGMNGVPQLSRQQSDYYLNAMSNGMAAVPAHMRPEMQATSRSSTPVQYQMQVNGQASRAPLTSQTSAGYNPPQILEPPTHNAQQSTSGNNSPHLAATMAWQSPQNGMTATSAAQSNEYAYPDPNNTYAVNPAAQMYYQQQQQQSRPHSTGPMDYQNQMRGHELWTQQQS